MRGDIVLKVNLNINNFVVKSVDLNNVANINEWIFKNIKEVEKVSFWENFLGYYITENELFLSIENQEGNIVGAMRGTIDEEKRLFILFYNLTWELEESKLKKIIFDSLLGDIESLGIKATYIAVMEGDVKSQYFWNSNGFTKIRRVKEYYCLENKDLIIMHK